MQDASRTAVLVVASMLVGAAITYLAMPRSITLKGENAQIQCYSGNQTILRDNATGSVQVTPRGHLHYVGGDGTDEVFITAPCMVRVTAPE